MVANAGTFVVNDLSDTPDSNPADGICANSSGFCTVRAAIQTANATAGTNTVLIPTGVFMIGSPLVIDSSDIIIQGDAAGATFLDGGGVTQVMQMNGSGRNHVIQKLTIRNGSSATGGGGLQVDIGTTVTLNRVELIGNNGLAGGGGGAYAAGTLNVVESTVVGNTSVVNGGAFILPSSGTLNLVRSTVSGNSVTGSAARGSAVFSSGKVQLTNSTITGNTATNGFSTITIQQGSIFSKLTTIAGNTNGAGGTQLEKIVGGGNTATIQNTIIANPIGGVNCIGIALAGGSLGGNLDSGSTCGFNQPSDLSNTDPLLGVLTSNGGPTPTMALLAGSPAIDAGVTDATVTTDQRNMPRPASAAYDIGAYEGGVSSLPTANLGGASIAEGNAGTSVLNFPVTLSAPAPAGGVTITYSTSDGSALAGSDYVAVVAGTVTILAGATSGNLPVIINGDTNPESDETFTVSIIGITGANRGTVSATGTILNDDAVVPRAVTPVPVNDPLALFLIACALAFMGWRAQVCERKPFGKR